MKKAFVFDFDDTLAITEACVQVYRPDTDWTIEELTPSEFNDYELKSGEAFDFSQFRCPDLVENGEPTDLICLAKEVHKENHEVYILTARSNAVSKAIARFLKIHGIKAKQIICLGDKNKSQHIASGKRKALLTIMESYDKTYYYDDCPKNIELAPKGKKIKKYKV